MGGTTPNAATSGRDAGSIKLARDQNKDFKSRVLNEKAQFWMKKTTYLTNDQTRAVHKFTSLADTKRKVAQETETMLEMNKQKHTDEQTIQAGFAMANNPALLGNKRKHPTKRGVTAVCDVPILPNVSSWGHTFTHVVIDNPPKEVPSKGSERPAATMEQLERAFVADVEKKRQNSRMMCNLLAPSDIRASDASEPTLFHVVQQYDLDVVPLKEEGTPHVNFLLLLEERPDGGGSASYHPIPSRVQLSTGRPAKRNMAGSIIAKRALDEQDMKELEGRVAEIDADLAEKYGLYETTNDNNSYPPSSKQNTDNEDDEEPPEKRRAMVVEEEEDRTF
jgi:RNA polymerase II-associated factor 1